MITPTKLLAFVSRGWLHAGPKERAIRDDLGMPPARYYQLLTKAMHDERAIANRSRLRRVVHQKPLLKYRLRYA